MLSPKSTLGITLLELLVALIIVGIVSTTAVMLYTKHVNRSRRSVAIQTILSIQLAEEHYRSTNSQYGDLSQVWNSIATTTGGYYALSISNLASTTYTITATAQGTQVNDSEDGTSCSSLVLAISGGTESKTPATCWLSN